MLKKWISSDESLQLENLKPGRALNVKAQKNPVLIAWLLQSWQWAGPHILISQNKSFLNQIRKNILFFEKYQKPVFLKDTISESLKKTFYAQWMTRAMLARTSEVFLIQTSSFLQKTIDPAVFKKNSFFINPGSVLPKNFTDRLKSLGWRERAPVEYTGEFSMQGMRLDLFPPSLEYPVRIELIGRQAGQIRIVDSTSQIKELKEIFISPVCQDVFSPDQVKAYMVEYFQQTPLLWILEEQNINKDILKKSRLLKFRSSNFTDLQDSSSNKNHFCFFSRTPPPHLFKTSSWREKIKKIKKEAFVFISVSSENSAKALAVELESMNLKPKLENLWPMMKQEQIEDEKVLHIINRPLSGNLQIITEGEEIYFLNFEKTPVKSILKNKNFKLNKQAEYFSEIKSGDLIVHKQYGIGQFQKLDILDFGSGPQEFLILKYKGGDLLYVPVYAFYMVQKYIGGLSSSFMDKLGVDKWIKRKKKVQNRLKDMTLELIKLYGARKKIQRQPFSAGSDFFKKFVSEFPFIETPDQQKAIQETLEDLTKKSSPADRLICGDAGYGKTEVALRAVIKVIEDGFQACVLTPTTLLSFQHFERFKERLQNYPIRIGLLNRFTSGKEKLNILKEVKQGSQDILIGTHRILSRDVYFKKLGLLVVDEEHLFGVADKEKLKKWQSSLDTLSLSATPIPRSLSMSLSGFKDISLINTPPLNRKPIKTFLNIYNEDLIKKAILKEQSRSGQMIFIHNRIADIHKIAEKLKSIAPSIRLRFAHGQMKDLQKAIARDFFYQKFDMLVCTTIVESGMDFPLAGTLFINNADEFGLSQLYQLRGRIGRSDKQAYCYLLIKERKKATEEALHRLKIIQENNQPGAGLAIAQYDLEMRGGGELMGAEQSGFVQDVGAEMYFELLQSAVSEAEGGASNLRWEPDLHFKTPAFLPKSYIPYEKLRLVFYKKFSIIECIEELDKLKIVLQDSVGTLPEEAKNFILINKIRCLAKKWHIREMSYKQPWLYINFSDTTPLTTQTALSWLKRGICEHRNKNTFRFFMKEENLSDVLDLCASFDEEAAVHS